jgi:hypothetical protein
VDLPNGGLAAAVGPGVLELHGRTFVLTPLSGPDELAVYQEMRRQVMAAAGDPLETINRQISEAERRGKPFSPTVVKALVDSALASAGKKEQRPEPTEADIAARLYDLDGARWLIWFRLRKADHSVTLDWVREAVPDDDAKNAVLHRMAQLAGLTDLDPKKA